MHEVLVNRLGGLSLPRKSVVRLSDRPDLTLDVYRGRKTTKQQQQQFFPMLLLAQLFDYICLCLCAVVLRQRQTATVMSGRPLNLTRVFLGRLTLLLRLTGAHTFARNWQLPKGETKVSGRTGFLTRDLWLLSQSRYRLRYAARQLFDYNTI